MNVRESRLKTLNGTSCGSPWRISMLFALSLGACARPHPVPPPVTPYDYKDRHPIVLSQAPFVIDVFPKSSGGRLDPESSGRLQRFAKKYAEFGHGPITVSVPTGGAVSGKIVSSDKSAILRTLAAAGYSDVRMAAYPVVDPALAAPFRLSFEGVKAKVADRCGLWPRDLASGTSLDGWQNETYWNFGCATQNMIATQAADPRDLVSPRGSTPADIEMRMRGIGKLRQGTDPATTWSGKAGTISGVGG